MDSEIAELEERIRVLEWCFADNILGFLPQDNGDSPGRKIVTLRENVQLLEMYISTRNVARASIKKQSETKNFKRRWIKVQAENNSVYWQVIDCIDRWLGGDCYHKDETLQKSSV